LNLVWGTITYCKLENQEAVKIVLCDRNLNIYGEGLAIQVKAQESPTGSEMTTAQIKSAANQPPPMGGIMYISFPSSSF